MRAIISVSVSVFLFWGISLSLETTLQSENGNPQTHTKRFRLAGPVADGPRIPGSLRCVDSFAVPSLAMCGF
uniref:Putative secreted protein n=1 Tax=Anopheles darlingi TaxID=43151 RepID=A0A2M4DI70_ANODA